MKMNRRLILWLVLVVIMSISAGCSNTSKEIPQGVSEEFYDDMISCFKKLEKYKDNDKKNGKDVIQNYFDNKIWLSHEERKIIEAIDDMYFWVWLYYNGEDTNIFIIKDKIRNVADLMEIQIKVEKIIPEK